MINQSLKEAVKKAENVIVNGRLKAETAINGAMILTYWQLGQIIVEEEQNGQNRAEYGKRIINEISRELTDKFGSGYSPRSLRDYRKFYLLFKDNEIWHACVPNLSWTHFRSLLRVENEEARNWYLREASMNQWSYRTLDRNIGTQYYERLLLSQKKDLVKREMLEKTADYEADKKLEFIKNPVVAEFLGLKNNPEYTEDDLEKAILDHIQEFLLEMGKGYAFVTRQKHIRTDLKDYFIDLVFFNYILNCFVLIDLKTSEITHQDIGQMDMYIRMYDDLVKESSHNPTLGIVLCTETDAVVAKYSVLHDSQQLFASKYKLYLPDEQELKKEIEQQKQIFRLQHSHLLDDSEEIDI